MVIRGGITARRVVDGGVESELERSGLRSFS